MDVLKPIGPAAEIGFGLLLAFSLTLAFGPTLAESVRVVNDDDEHGTRDSVGGSTHFGRGARWFGRMGGGRLPSPLGVWLNVFLAVPVCGSGWLNWDLGVSGGWGRGWKSYGEGGADPGGIRVCLLACLAEIRWLRRRARRDSATVERILTLINIYIFICAPFCVYFAAKFGPFRSLLIKSPLQCNTPMYVRISLDCWLLSGCPNSDCSLFNCQTIWVCVFIVHPNPKWFLCPALPAIWWLVKSSEPGFMNPNWPGLVMGPVSVLVPCTHVPRIKETHI